MFPTFYDPAKVNEVYSPNVQRSFDLGLAAFQHPASEDKQRVLLWLVDMQIDFVFPAPIGRLSVPNALDDTRRIIEWLYRNVQSVTHVAASLDTHMPFHIFYPTWWQNEKGERPAPYTVITAQEVHKGVWKPITEAEWSTYYVDTLENVGKKQLMIWPFHCMEGTEGRALVPALAEAIMFHSVARMDQPTYLTKGTIAQTEFYSVVEPEVKYPGHPDGKLNVRFLEIVSQFDLIYVAGEARSHCVLETMRSVLRHFAKQPQILGKLRFLDDCTSSITGFEEATEAEIRRFAEQGIRLVKAADPLG